MSIPYQASSALLCGELQMLPEGSILQVCVVQISMSNEVEVSFPAEVQELLEKFAELFEVTTKLPPQRACDHSIPLMQGVAPVRSEALPLCTCFENEIEKQIKMLDKMIIQPSSSQFSSSVLLVKKKDNSWRFCVDYHHLNSITIKSKYPVPVIDEFP
jgi:hypothetical protein